MGEKYHWGGGHSAKELAKAWCRIPGRSARGLTPLVINATIRVYRTNEYQHANPERAASPRTQRQNSVLNNSEATSRCRITS